MPRFKTWVRVVVVVGAAAAGGALVAQERPGPSGPGRGPIWENSEVIEKIGLTDDQIAKLKARHYHAARSSIEMRSRIQLAELELEQLMGSDQPDESAVAAKAKEIGALRARQFESRVADRMALKKILTPEQERGLREIMIRNHGRRQRPEESGRRRREPVPR